MGAVSARPSLRPPVFRGTMVTHHSGAASAARSMVHGYRGMMSMRPPRSFALVLQPHPEHDDRASRARAGDVRIQHVTSQRALQPEITGHPVDQIAFERVGLVAAAK